MRLSTQLIADRQSRKKKPTAIPQKNIARTVSFEFIPLLPHQLVPSLHQQAVAREIKLKLPCVIPCPVTIVPTAHPAISSTVHC